MKNKTVLLLILFFIYTKNINAQVGFGFSRSCEINVNHPGWPNNYDDIKRATFEYYIGYSSLCSGVLLNQDVNKNQNEQYFLTAWHCLNGQDLSAVEFQFIFNFQSSDGNSNSVPIVNRGFDIIQSDNSNNGYQCFLKSHITLIDYDFAHDLALVKINEPIPPHFNVYYAGWQIHNGTIDFSTFNLMYAPFVLIHHPSGDIKKISRSSAVQQTEDLLNAGCTIVTTIIDAIFCFFGLCNVNTQLICNYVDIPFYNVFGWSDGTTEGGSSGAPLFTNAGKVIGCENGFPSIDFCPGINGSDPVSKFKDFYQLPAVHHSLNPQNDFSIRTWGMTGREVNCYDYLNLSGQYYPLGNYQSDNHLELHANHDININGPLHIHEGSDYTFSAGNDINFGNDFVVDNVNDFTAKPGSTSNNCNPNTYRLAHDNSPMDAIRNIISNLPKSKKFNINEHLNPVIVFPNPSEGQFTLSVLYNKDFNIQIYNIMGKKIFSTLHHSNGVYEKQNFEINFENEVSGFYNIELIGMDGKTWSKKLIISK